ncbi:uncharacterized protein I206_101128 [Kwoniella pini CBS 10737]|uniref:Uncharacterized protein n=1 Tax=Kwoniella pini CBS 10737 TaxID=1296096 RepID=A0A1B9IBX3_9TREE|nr:uncharacterized protein I206_00198 [Kwoniella pini CBS 10737]OCF52897.1 hypothetical protein I206_00198 [Kwoniella pini CBS 10737]
MSTSPIFDNSRPAKRARTTRSQNSSSSSRTESAESSKRDKGKGKAQSPVLAVESDTISNHEGKRSRSKKVDEVKSERTKRAWETRRRAKVTIPTIEDDDQEAGPSTSLAHWETPLPNTDFLLSIHKHASRFYTNHELLFEHHTRSRAYPWGSKKRLMLIQDAKTGKNLKGLSDTSSSFKSNPKSKNYNNEDDEEIDELDEDDDDSQIIVKQELVDEYGELLRSNRDNSSNFSGKRDRPTGKYKKRDMYRAIEGEGLMALGILLQEHIIKSIHSSGYRKMIPSSSVHPLAYTEEIKAQKRKRISTTNLSRNTAEGNDNEREIESEEG